MPNWFVVRKGKEHGPFNDGQLKNLATSGKISRTDLIRREGKTGSVKAGDIKGLFPDKSSSTPAAKVPPAPPPLPPEHPPQKASGPHSPLQKLRSIFEVGQDEANLKAKILRSAKLLLGIILMIPLVIIVISNVLGALSSGFEALGGGAIDLQNVKESEIIKAPELSTLYTENEAAADSQYKGKTVFIEGFVIEVTKKSGKTMITLDEDYADNGPGHVLECELSSSALNSPELQSIRRGTKVLVGGNCAGKLFIGSFVTIRNSEFKVLQSSIYY